jgi:hypothetical protein
MGRLHSKVIVMLLADRPAYAAQTIEALRQCEGVEDYLFLPHVEPGPHASEIADLLDGEGFFEMWPIFNRTRLGFNGNATQALNFGFTFAPTDRVIMVEEDVLLAPDALRYFEWALGRYEADPRVFSVTAYHRSETAPDAVRWHDVRRRRWFHPWGYALWRDRWEALRGHVNGRESLDTTATRLLLSGTLGTFREEVYPELSRSQNIGRESTSELSPPPEWFDAHHRVKHWAGDVAVPWGEWREVKS